MYTGGGLPGQFRGPIPTKEAIPDSPPTDDPPPAPTEQNDEATRTSSKPKKSFRKSMAAFGTLKRPGISKTSSPLSKRNTTTPKRSDSSILSIASKKQ